MNFLTSVFRTLPAQSTSNFGIQDNGNDSVEILKTAANRDKDSGAMFQLSQIYAERIKTGNLAWQSHNAEQATSYLNDAVANGNEEAANYVINTILHVTEHIEGIIISKNLLLSSLNLLLDKNSTYLDSDKRTLSLELVTAQIAHQKEDCKLYVTMIARTSRHTNVNEMSKDYHQREIKPWKDLQQKLVESQIVDNAEEMYEQL